MFKELNKYAYIVGGAVRDKIMGITPKDYDYVLTVSQEQFQEVFPNIESVGVSFPVYIIDGHEVALSRTEKSIGNKYNDFEVTGIGVTIEEDLSRRDFTMNSMAEHYITGEIIDPFNGVSNIENKSIRTINSKAFEEDPLRMLRAIRFAIRYDFNIHEDTEKRIKENAYRIKYVPYERITKELEKVYSEKTSLRKFFEMMLDLGLLEYCYPDIFKLTQVTAGPVAFHYGNTAFEHTMEAVSHAEYGFKNSFSVVIATLFHDVGKGMTPEDILPHHYGHEYRGYYHLKENISKYRFDKYTNELAILSANLHMKVHFITKMRDVKLVKFFGMVPKNYWNDFFEVCNSDHEMSFEQLNIKEKLEKINEMVYDVDKIEKAKNKRDEVDKQRLYYFRGL